MKKRAMLAFGIFIAVGLLLIVVTKSPGSNAEASATQVKFMWCPATLVAPYGGTDGWSKINVAADFTGAGFTNPAGAMKCEYGFGGPNAKTFFAIIQPCPAGYKCEIHTGMLSKGKGFRLTPIK